MSIEFKDHSKEVLSELGKREEKALQMIGLKWQKIVTKIITEKKIVDTGRLRQSMTYDVDPSNKRVVVGTDVEYAIFNESGTKKMPARPFLKPSVLDYVEDYKEIAEKVIGEGATVSVEVQQRK